MRCVLRTPYMIVRHVHGAVSESGDNRKHRSIHSKVGCSLSFVRVQEVHARDADVRLKSKRFGLVLTAARPSYDLPKLYLTLHAASTAEDTEREEQIPWKKKTFGATFLHCERRACKPIPSTREWESKERPSKNRRATCHLLIAL